MTRGVVAAALLVVGCRGGEEGIVLATPAAVTARLVGQGHFVDASLAGGAVRYLGFEVTPPHPRPGESVTLRHHWQATAEPPAEQRVFVHFLVQGARGWLPHGDHDPEPPTQAWPVGRVVATSHRLLLPATLPADAVELRVGLYRGETRLAVDASHDDGTRRIVAGSFAVAGTPLALPSYAAPRLPLPIRLDGVIDDDEWGGAPWTPPFVATSGRANARCRTRARLAWDAESLYVAFDAEDPDILATFTGRDDPLYREEAVELFIDPEGRGRSYFELQSNPLGAQFDAAFHGGPRRNFRRGWNARFAIAVGVEGRVESPDAAAMITPDVGWRSEWRIDAASIPGLRMIDGATLRLNLLRVGKDRGADGILPDESAWSPPLMGDFHNLERFGFVRLVPARGLVPSLP